MGELILVLIITCIVCGGVPLLAFAYMNGKLNIFNRNPVRATSKTFVAAKSNPKVFLCVALVLGTFFGCFTFPVFNLTKVVSRNIGFINFVLAGSAYYEIGVIEGAAFPLKKGPVSKTIFTLLGFNCIHILAGMGCRYLLEFGETSNTYNFTMPNIVVHLLVVNAFCLASWYFSVRKHQNNPRQEK